MEMIDGTKKARMKMGAALSSAVPDERALSILCVAQKT
jgi:hypothetical protein